MKQPKVSLIVVYSNENNLQVSLNILTRQSFSDIEIICVSNAATDDAQKIAEKMATNDERIKLVNLPILNEDNVAKQLGLGIASGDFVCFVNPEVVQGVDFVKNMVVANLSAKKMDLLNDHLYRRTFLENDEEISSLIKDEIKLELEHSAKTIQEQKNEIKNEFNKFYQSNVETIKNNAYEVVCRFNQLEKLFYEKDYENQQKINNIKENLNAETDGSLKKVYEDIAKVYDFINSEINKKGCEINNVYEEISKNYSYTEKLVSEKQNEAVSITSGDKDAIWQKFSELEKEIIVRYVNLKRLLDSQIDELDSKLKASEGGNYNNYNSVDLEKTVSENIDNMYSRLNNTSSMFYEELSKIYKDLNEKLIKKSEEDRYYIEQKVTELRNEFDSKLQALKKEITG